MRLQSPPGTRQWILTDRTRDSLIDQILMNRGIIGDHNFLAPNYPDGLHDPLVMRGMPESVERLVRALEHNEIIGIFADYDTDGTPGSALLIDGLRQLGAQLSLYIPTREEGYGLSQAGIDSLREAGATVIVTIDLGITGKRYADYTREVGIDLIVTDHHIIQPDLFPDSAFAVINPKQPGCPYPFKELCGGGIIWKLMGALLAQVHAEHPDRLKGRNPEAIHRWLLDLAAISTICDMVPLVDENRIIAQFGLKVLQKTRRPGLQALYQVAGIEPGRMSASVVGFQIGPRINAPTRLNAQIYRSETVPGPHASPAVALLVTPSQDEARDLAGRLNDYNQDRKLQLETVLEEADRRVQDERLYERNIILLAHPDWPPGIVGLVAGRLMEKYGRPTIVLGIADGEATGSARSVDGFHLIEALAHVQGRLKKFGGHAKAAGLTVELHHLDHLYDELLAYGQTRLTSEMLGPRLRLDAELTEADLTLDFAHQLASLAPHGIGNPRPSFLVRNVTLADVRAVGSDGQHMKAQVVFPGSGQRVGVIGFGLRLNESFTTNQLLDLACQLEVNEWQGRERVELHLLDFRLAELPART